MCVCVCVCVLARVHARECVRTHERGGEGGHKEVWLGGGVREGGGGAWEGRCREGEIERTRRFFIGLDKQT